MKNTGTYLIEVVEKIFEKGDKTFYNVKENKALAIIKDLKIEDDNSFEFKNKKYHVLTIITLSDTKSDTKSGFLVALKENDFLKYKGQSIEPIWGKTNEYKPNQKVGVYKDGKLIKEERLLV